MRIKDIPLNERPREKLLRFGSQRLSDVELLAVIIGSGTKDFSVLDISHNLINKRGLRYLINEPLNELITTKGIAKIKAIQLHAMFELFKRIEIYRMEEVNTKIDASFIINKYGALLHSYDHEVFGIIILDGNGRVLRETILNEGNRHNVYVSNRDIFKLIALVDGQKFYVFHNHTGEIATPSDKDIVFTSKLLSESKKLGYQLLDHLIIAQRDYFSFLGDDSQSSNNLLSVVDN